MGHGHTLSYLRPMARKTSTAPNDTLFALGSQLQVWTLQFMVQEQVHAIEIYAFTG